MYKQKKSFGIALCRVNPENNNSELLLINKKNTYAYCDFILGRYTINRITRVVAATKSQKQNTICIGKARLAVANKKRVETVTESSTSVEECISDLLDKMTVDEKITILSLNFDQIWGRIFLDRKFSQYFTSRSKFDGLVSDGGVELKKMISKSKNGRELWEMPKGRKDSRVESEIFCAMREFEEETKIKPTSYRIFPNVKFNNTFVDCGIQYSTVYYLAIADDEEKISTDVVVSYGEQAGEIKDMQWMNIEKIALIDVNRRIEKLARSIFKCFRRKLEEV